MMKLTLIALLISVNYGVSIASEEKYHLNQFCQDLNIALAKIDLINLNIKNAETTRTASGGPYLRKYLDKCNQGICRITEDKVAVIHRFDPNHPDAIDNGYVRFPNINVAKEMEELIHITTIKEDIMKNKPFSSKDLLTGNKMKDCFSKYSYVDRYLNHRKFLNQEQI